MLFITSGTLALIGGALMAGASFWPNQTYCLQPELMVKRENSIVVTGLAGILMVEIAFVFLLKAAYS